MSILFTVTTDGPKGPGLIEIDSDDLEEKATGTAEDMLAAFTEEFHGNHNQKSHGRRGGRTSETPGELASRVEKMVEGFKLPANHSISDVRTNVSTDGKEIEVNGRILDSAGKATGAFNRIIVTNEDDKYLYNDSLFINPRSQALGIGSSFADQFEAMTKEEFGVTDHRLLATEVGKYAWAKRGYAPYGDAALEIGDTWMTHMKNHGELTSQQRTDLKALDTAWENGTPVQPYDLFAINKDAASDAMFSGPEWEGKRDIG